MGGVSRDIQGKVRFKAFILFNFQVYAVRAYLLKVFGIALCSSTNYGMIQTMINFCLSIWTLCEKDLKENTFLYTRVHCF